MSVNANIIGFNPKAKSATAEHTLGTKNYQLGRAYIYAQASGNIAAAGEFDLDGGFATTVGTTYSHDIEGAGNVLVANDYFWARHQTSTVI